MRQYDLRYVNRLLIENGYRKIRCRGSHWIYDKENSQIISVPTAKMKAVVIQRLIKENGLKEI